MRISEKEDGLTHRMPAHLIFYDPSQGGLYPYDDVTTLELWYKTDIEPLRKIIPEEFELLAPIITITYQKCNGVQWMGGSEYSLVTVSTPVRYMETEEPVEGVFHHVLWEDKTAPIIGGREEAGMPKVFADIPEYRRLEKTIFFNVSHEGKAFLELELLLDKAFSAEEIAKMNENNGRLIQLGWRYIPKVGPFPGADLSQATYYPVDNEYSSGSSLTGTVKWTEPAYYQHPAQHAIISVLAAIPILEYIQGSFKKGKSCMRMDLARTLP
ncbi:MAG: acetoacetate decarboxylase family protein [Methanospirillum sp.]|nr:acetoacetate decarboxylase family protein [Methanospirillum sp.]